MKRISSGASRFTLHASRVPVILATRNRNKLRELQRLTRALRVRWLTLDDFPWIPPVQEDGRTFAANARKKALAVASATGCVAVADDSGLEVNALGGAPGVRSARYACLPRRRQAGPRATDDANNRQLLRALRRLPSSRRHAQFRCCIAIATPDGEAQLAEGRVRGMIAARPRGRTGFGYDPLFIIPRYLRTFAELGSRVKDRLSHRAQALRRAAPRIQQALRRYG